jgi:hypothetical protein
MEVDTKKYRSGILILLAIFMGAGIWWNLPTSIIDIEPSEVSRITVFNGNTGDSMTITHTDHIQHIIGNLNGVSLKKYKVSVGYVGYSFRTTIYDTNGNIHEELYINSDEIIRKDPFFYRDKQGGIDYNYIQDLFEEEIK